MLTELLYTKLNLILVLLLTHNNDTVFDKRKELELKRNQNLNLDLPVEVKTRFQGLSSHPVFQVAKLEHKTAPAPFIVTYLDFN